MSEINMKRDFNILSKELKSDNFDLRTISNIVSNIRMHNGNLTAEQAKKLLEIPINVLENDVELISKVTWQSEHAHYFSGNITWVESDYFIKLKHRFANKNYTLSDIIDIAKIVGDEFDEYRSASEFLLRNVEVVLRDDVRLTGYTNFKQSGNVYAKIIDDAIGL